jgi:hypothetical protein
LDTSSSSNIEFTVQGLSDIGSKYEMKLIGINGYECQPTGENYSCAQALAYQAFSTKVEIFKDGFLSKKTILNFDINNLNGHKVTINVSKHADLI